jgi:hypothetical protein
MSDDLLLRKVGSKLITGGIGYFEFSGWMKNPFETFIQCAKVGRGMDRPGLTAAFLSIHNIYRGQVPLIQHRMKFPMPYGKFDAVVSVIDLPATRGCFYRSSTPFLKLCG